MPIGGDSLLLPIHFTNVSLWRERPLGRASWVTVANLDARPPQAYRSAAGELLGGRRALGAHAKRGVQQHWRDRRSGTDDPARASAYGARAAPADRVLPTAASDPARSPY